MTTLVSICIPLFFMAAVVSAAAAFIFLFRAVITHSYEKIDPRYFNDKDKMSLPKNIFSGVMVTYYITALDHNRKTNDKRVKLYRCGWTSAVISLGLFVVYVLLTG